MMFLHYFLHFPPKLRPLTVLLLPIFKTPSLPLRPRLLSVAILMKF